MACGGSRYLSWCTPHGGRARVRENECENRANFVRICCKFAFAMAPPTRGQPVVGIGHFVAHCGTLASQKGAISFRRHADFKFLRIFRNIATIPTL